MRKVRETGKASLGGKKAGAGGGEYYHLTQTEYDEMLADPDCDKELFESEAEEILEKKRIEAELAYKIRADALREAGLSHWIDQ